MDPDYKISRPISKSSIAAEKEASIWTEEQEIKEVYDGDGDRWAVELKTEEAFESTDQADYMYRVAIILQQEMGAKELITSGILSAKEDKRKLDLIGNRRVILRMKPVEFKDSVEFNAKNAAREYLMSFRAKLSGASLMEFKRRLFDKWLDQSMRFCLKNKKRLVAGLRNI